MSKEDVPSRSASLTFTIDNILNLKPRDSGDLDAAKGQRNRGWKKDVAALRDDERDVRRRTDSGAERAGRRHESHQRTCLPHSDWLEVWRAQVEFILWATDAGLKRFRGLLFLSVLFALWLN